MSSLSWTKVGIASGVAVGLLCLSCGPAPAVTKPDLVVTELSEPPASALPGESFAVSITVTNQGTADSLLSTTKFFLVNGSTRKNLKGVHSLPALGVGESHPVSLTLGVYSDTAAATYTFQACADGDDANSELVETNNCATAAGAITILQAPDLVISSLSNPPSSGGQGQGIVVKGTVKNIGPVSADASSTKYSLVSTEVGGGKIDLKGLQSVPPLDPGDTYNVEQAVTIRPETEPGTYRLEACADGGKIEPEQDENNNCRTSTGIITVTARPDLIVTSVGVTGAPLTVQAGANLTVTAGVLNQGLANAQSNTMKFVLINTLTGAEKNLKNTASVPALAAGLSTTVAKTVTVYADTASGTYTVRACVDSTKVVQETFDGNNCDDTTETVTVQGVTPTNADLVVTSLTDPPASALPGGSFPITAVVMNEGTEAAPATQTSFFLINAATGARKNAKGTQSIGPLLPGGSEGPTATISLYADTLPGAYRFEACADGPKTLPESTETDNCRQAAGMITVLEVPNLVVPAMTRPPGILVLGQSFELTNTVKNIGAVGAGASDSKYFLVSALDGTKKDLKGTQAVPALDAGHSFTEQALLTVRPETVTGQYKLQVCADGGRAVPEGNEDDNCLTSGVITKVIGPPDLVVTAVTVRNAPVTVARGGSVTITATIKNMGEGGAAASNLKYLLVNPAGGTKNLNGTKLIASLPGGNATTVQQVVTVFGDTAFGTYTVRVCADSGEVVTEASETNNCGNSTGTVTVQ